MLELLAVMAVFALLTGLIFQQILILRRNSRDSERISTGTEIVEFINDFRKENNFEYPSTNEVSIDDSEITISSVATDLVDESVTKTIIKTFDLDKFLKASTNTSSSSTRYYYGSERGGFSFCILLESGSVRDFGNEECPATSEWN